MTRAIAVVGLLLLVPVGAASAGDQAATYWPQWRGPLQTGAAPDAQPPLEWSETKNVAWKVEIPGKGSATPVVWGDRMLDLGRVANLAEVTLNGVPCGVAWIAPYRVEVTGALKDGKNHLRIDVTNTWANRLIGDHERPEDERLTWTTANYALEGEPLLEAGLLGPVVLAAE